MHVCIGKHTTHHIHDSDIMLFLMLSNVFSLTFSFPTLNIIPSFILVEALICISLLPPAQLLGIVMSVRLRAAENGQQNKKGQKCSTEEPEGRDYTQ